jgi:predicted nucleic acid-binding protein
MRISSLIEISIGVTDFLLDANVISELRKGSRASPAVTAWYAALDDDAVFLSVLVVGELSRGVERIRRRDEISAQKLEIWLRGIVDDFGDRVLPVTEPIARIWGGYGVPDPIPTVDGLLAATAQHHRLVLATRNVKDVASTGVAVVNPFEKLRAQAESEWLAENERALSEYAEHVDARGVFGDGLRRF